MGNEEEIQANTGQEAESEADVAQTSEETGELSREALEQRVGELEQQLQEARDELMRARAEAENVRKRAERDIDKTRRYALEKFAEELLPVKDSLELALSAAEDPNVTVEKFREGTELTLKMLNQVFERFDIAELNPTGDKFNPEQHEAMSMQESAEQAPNTVLTVYQKGYMLSDRLLRPAMVTVARSPNGDKGGQVNDEA